jgi:Ion channel
VIHQPLLVTVEINNIWKNDKGFIWMLAIGVLALISSQISEGIIVESKFLVRLCFYLITIIAIKSSSLSNSGKLTGYTFASSILLLAIAMIWTETPLLILIYSALITCYMVFIIVLVVNQIFANEIITTYKVGGGVAVYILLGHVWASLYLTIYMIHPVSFQFGGEIIRNEDAMKQLSYFSFVTLTTIGYGDVTAMSSAARVLAILEGLFGQLFPAIFIAKLVSLQIGSSRK